MELYFAPMEGITTCTYRNAYHRYFGGVDRYYTPFLTCSNLKGKDLYQVAPENNQGFTLVPQILTKNADLFCGLASQFHALGYEEVNLNLGCPSGTVVRKGHGAGFLANREELTVFLDKIFSNTGAEISVKTRVGMNDLAEWPELLKIYKKFPIKELTIHPRLGREMYRGVPHLTAFAEAVKAYADGTSITKLCYNGDIVTASDTEAVLSRINNYLEVHADGLTVAKEDLNLMVGRGILRNPWLPGELGEQQVAADSRQTQLRGFLNALKESYLSEMKGNEAPVLMKLKEVWTYLGKGLTLEKDSYKAILKCKTLADYNAVVNVLLLKL